MAADRSAIFAAGGSAADDRDLFVAGGRRSEGSRSVTVRSGAGPIPAEESSVILAEESATGRRLPRAEVTVAEQARKLGASIGTPLCSMPRPRHCRRGTGRQSFPRAAHPWSQSASSRARSGSGSAIPISLELQTSWFSGAESSIGWRMGSPVYASEPIAPLEGNWRLDGPRHCASRKISHGLPVFTRAQRAPSAP